MSDPANQGEQSEKSSLWALAGLAVLSTLLYAAIALLSWQFDYDNPGANRPIIVVLLLFAVAFAGYLLAIRLATRAPKSRRVLAVIFWGAILFRLVLLFSVPIQEIDIYRYVWDGAVSSSGVSPFRYSPEQVRLSYVASTEDKDLRALVEMRDRDPALAKVLSRVHFAELPTIYPPTSQVVFAAANLTTPTKTNVGGRLIIMKAWFCAFDLGTLVLVVRLLKLAEKPVGLCIIHAWCPLLLKEFANSGHLDAIAVFLAVLAVFLAALLLKQNKEQHGWFRASALGSLAAVVLALAVGAKLYPVVIAPLIFLVLVKKVGWRPMIVPALIFIGTTIAVLFPMLPRKTVVQAGSEEVAPENPSDVSLPPPPAETPPSDASTSDPILGVKTFLRRWEMNDFIFLLLIENLKPAADLPQDRQAWFSVLPEPFRQRTATNVASWLDVDPIESPFLTSRALTSAVFLLVAMLLAWRAARAPSVTTFCEAGFLTLAWFWLLCPTQNPWYWTWAVPLLPFARGRAWLAMSGLVLLYYLRFWLNYHWPETPVAGTNYIGYVFFDFIVTWIEFAPWFLWLIIEAASRTVAQRSSLDKQMVATAEPG